MEKLNLIVVFLEGVLSFFSPCILPILPIYLSMLSNSSIDNIRENNFVKTSLFRNTIFFALGISTTFFILGTSVNLFRDFFIVNKDIISFIGGIIIVIMGLFYVDILKSSLLNKEKRFNMQVKDMNVFTAFLLGFTFSFGWTPCIGPILASVLIMVSGASNSVTGNLLIGVYTLGFIMPFLLVSLFYSKLYRSIDKIKSNMDKIKKIGGVILIISGMLMIYSGFDGVRAMIYIKENTSIKREESLGKNDEEIDKIKAIDFTLTDQYGNKHILSDYEGKTVFLNFWATWCPPCKMEMPHIEDIYKEYGLNKEEVVILGVASPNLGKEGTQEDITEFLKNQGYTFPVVFDDGGQLAYEYGFNALPSTYIIDKSGNVVQYVPGAMDKDTMIHLIESARDTGK